MLRILLIIIALYGIYYAVALYWEKHRQNKLMKEAKKSKIMRDLKKKTFTKSEDVDKWYEMSKEDRSGKVDKIQKLISRIIVKDPKLTKDLTFIGDCINKDVLSQSDKKKLNKLKY